MEKSRYLSEIQKLGMEIRKLRMDKEMTQETLSSLCDIDVRTIQRIEKGQQNITLNILFAISESLNVKPEYLIKASFL